MPQRGGRIGRLDRMAPREADQRRLLDEKPLRAFSKRAVRRVTLFEIAADEIQKRAEQPQREERRDGEVHDGRTELQPRLSARGSEMCDKAFIVVKDILEGRRSQ